jgi:hypothetical protein
MGVYGLQVQQIANYLKKKEIFTHFGTDAHSLHGITRIDLPSARAKSGAFP